MHTLVGLGALKAAWWSFSDSVTAGRQGGERLFQAHTEFTACFTPVGDALEARVG